MKKEKRFVKVYSQDGFSTSYTVIADKETGVHYLMTHNGYGGGLTVLLGSDGKPVIKPVIEEE